MDKATLIEAALVAYRYPIQGERREHTLITYLEAIRILFKVDKSEYRRTLEAAVVKKFYKL